MPESHHVELGREGIAETRKTKESFVAGSIQGIQIGFARFESIVGRAEAGAKEPLQKQGQQSSLLCWSPGAGSWRFSSGQHLQPRFAAWIDEAASA